MILLRRMKRVQALQLTTQKWFPDFLKKNIFEFMTWFVGKVNAAKPFIPIIEEGMQHIGQIVNMDCEVGAGFETIVPYLNKDIPVKTTSLRDPKTSEKGLYVSINAFHKLRPDEARSVLNTVAQSRNPIAILEGNNDSLWQTFGMIIIVPVTVILTAPFVKPFRISRLIFTYLIPILPLITFFDGFMALFMLYAPKDLDELTTSIDVQDYSWRCGKLNNGRGGKIIYLLGWPRA